MSLSTHNKAKVFPPGTKTFTHNYEEVVVVNLYYSSSSIFFNVFASFSLTQTQKVSALTMHLISNIM